MEKLTIQLTSEQQKQIKERTGKNISKLNIDLAASGSLSEKDLEKVQGGGVEILIKIPGVDGEATTKPVMTTPCRFQGGSVR